MLTSLFSCLDYVRYDVLVPIEVLFPDLVASEGLPPHLALNDNCDDDTSNNSSNSSSGSALVGTSFKAPPLPRPNAAEPGDAWSNEWVEGFRDLKHLLQRFQGRHNWHNFCPGVRFRVARVFLTTRSSSYASILLSIHVLCALLIFSYLKQPNSLS